MLTEAIVETFNELKNAVMTHARYENICVVVLQSFRKNYYDIPSRLHILDVLADTVLRLNI